MAVKDHGNGGGILRQQGDFTASTRLLWISALALVIGALCAVAESLMFHALHRAFRASPKGRHSTWQGDRNG